MRQAIDIPALVERLSPRFGAQVAAGPADALDPWIEVAPAALVDVCTHLRDEPGLRMNLLQCITGVDYFEPDEKKAAKVDWQPHVEVLYHLSSTICRHRLMIKVTLPRWKNDREGQPPELPTVSHLWRTAEWHEREVYDLFGVRFLDHPDLRRILLPEDWVGHPLRKDYQMPAEYHGIRSK